MIAWTAIFFYNGGRIASSADGTRKARSALRRLAVASNRACRMRGGRCAYQDDGC